VRKALVVLAALALSMLTVAVGRWDSAPRTLGLKSAASPHSLLAFQVGREGDQHLLRIDARTLRPRRGPRLLVTGHAFGWSYSPDGRLLALGDDSGGEVFLVDTRRLSLAGRVSASDYGQVFATAWLGERLLALANLCCHSDEPATEEGFVLAVIDPERRRRLSARPLDGSIQGIAHTSSALVLLLGPRNALGPTRIAVVDAEGAMRSATLDRIFSGQDRDAHDRPYARSATPGLALDLSGDRAFVVGAGAPVAEVDLTTLAVSYHDLSTPISLLGRIGSWLEPAAEAKVPLAGPVRSARWLGDGFLAVWGHDTEVTGEGRNVHMREIAAGVKLIDTRGWRVRTLDPAAVSFAVAGETLLTYGARWDSATRKMSGVGLTAFGPTGSVRYKRFGSASIHIVHPLGSRIAVQDSPRFYSILDARTGGVLHRFRGAMPQPLIR
jgi:hypothetical protein